MENRGPIDSRGPMAKRGPMDNRGPRGNDSRLGPGQDFPRDQPPHFKRGPKNQGRGDGILGSPPHGGAEMWPHGPPPGLGVLGPAPGMLGQPLDENRDLGADEDSHHVSHQHRGYRGGMSRGGMRRGHDSHQSEERNGDNRPRGPSFPRGFNPNGRGSQGPDDDRPPWQPGGEPTDSRFRRQDGPDRRTFDRPPWDGPPEDMGQPNHRGREFAPHDPRSGPPFGRGPPNDMSVRGPEAERRLSDDGSRQQDSKPKPLMSLMSINPIVPPHNRTLDIDDSDMPPFHRKFPNDGEQDRDWDRPPQQKHMFPPPVQAEERLDNREGRSFPEDQVGWRGRGAMR